MKIENTLQNKAKFFGAHILQPVSNKEYKQTGLLSGLHIFNHLDISKIRVSIGVILDKEFVFETAIATTFSIETSMLNLKSTASISTEDASVIMAHEGYVSIQATKDHVKEHEDYLRSSTVDYLRSKGYAVPWMGLSINKMLKYGWLK